MLPPHLPQATAPALAEELALEPPFSTLNMGVLTERVRSVLAYGDEFESLRQLSPGCRCVWGGAAVVARVLDITEPWV